MKQINYIETYCTGCGLCHSANGAELREDNRGFPTVQIAKNDSLDFFSNVCPIFYYHSKAKHDVWGTVQKALVGYSADKDVRFKAASGGALTELCTYLLETNRVNGIMQTTFDPKDPTRNISVISTTVEEVRQRCGSRYSISVPLENFLESIEEGKKYAFVGKPCDVMALRRYLAIKPELNAVIPYLLSFFCAGEPSRKAQDNLLNKMNCRREECKSITYRGNGWPGYTTVVKKDGSVQKLEYKVTWGSYLGRDLRNICRFCMDGTGDAADIVCADFWYLDDCGNPDFSEHEGRNIIISRTSQGTDILSGAIESGRIICESCFTEHMDEFYKYQPAQYKRKGTMGSVILAMRLCGRKTPQYSKSYLKKYAAHLTAKVKSKYFFGMLKRIVKGKI